MKKSILFIFGSILLSLLLTACFHKTASESTPQNKFTVPDVNINVTLPEGYIAEKAEMQGVYEYTLQGDKMAPDANIALSKMSFYTPKMVADFLADYEKRCPPGDRDRVDCLVPDGITYYENLKNNNGGPGMLNHVCDGDTCYARSTFLLKGDTLINIDTIIWPDDEWEWNEESLSDDFMNKITPEQKNILQTYFTESDSLVSKIIYELEP